MKNRFFVLLIKKVILMSICICLVSCGGERGASSQIDNNSSAGDEDKEYSNEVQVVVLLGQSNMEGHSCVEYLTKTVGAEKASLYAAGFDNVKISFLNSVDGNSSGGDFIPVKVGQGSMTDRFGPEVGIAERISATDPRKPVYLIKYA